MTAPWPSRLPDPRDAANHGWYATYHRLDVIASTAETIASNATTIADAARAELARMHHGDAPQLHDLAAALTGWVCSHPAGSLAADLLKATP